MRLPSRPHQMDSNLKPSTANATPQVKWYLLFTTLARAGSVVGPREVKPGRDAYGVVS